SPTQLRASVSRPYAVLWQGRKAGRQKGRNSRQGGRKAETTKARGREGRKAKAETDGRNRRQTSFNLAPWPFVLPTFCLRHSHPFCLPSLNSCLPALLPCKDQILARHCL